MSDPKEGERTREPPALRDGNVGERSALRSGLHYRGYLPHMKAEVVRISSRFGLQTRCLVRFWTFIV